MRIPPLTRWLLATSALERDAAIMENTREPGTTDKRPVPATERSADSHVRANRSEATSGYLYPRSEQRFKSSFGGVKSAHWVHPPGQGGAEHSSALRSPDTPSLVVPIILLCTLLLISCSPKTETAQSPSTPSPTNQRTYAVTGLVLSVESDLTFATIKHQDIPGYMLAMTMPFAVKDTNELAGLIPGEEITFNMIVTDDDMWMEQVKKTGFVTNLLPANAGIRIVREVEPLRIGDPVPEYQFTNEQGQAVSLSQFKGDAVLLSFLFTRCPVPNFCPLTARKLAEVQNELPARPGGPTNWHILAITIDPEYDTPDRLKQFGETYGYDPNRWSFLTGEWIDITALGEQFGLTFWKEEGVVNHNLRTVVVDAGGSVRTNIVGNEWAVSDLVNAMVKACGQNAEVNP